MKIIGITGGVGAGKTQILEYLNNKYGATICQADQVGKKLQKKGTPCFEAIVEHFGTDILDEKGELDRERLAEVNETLRWRVKCMDQEIDEKAERICELEDSEFMLEYFRRFIRNEDYERIVEMGKEERENKRFTR